jgi:hypothetical protein
MMTVERFSVPMKGKLRAQQKEGDYVVLEVPEDFAESVFEAVKQPGMEKPPRYRPHISVFTDEEVKKIGELKEAGQEFEFTIVDIVSVEPQGWKEMDRAYFIRCRSPQLEELRRKYGLSSLPFGDHPFHITIAVIPKKA